VFEKISAELGLDPTSVRWANLGDQDSPLPKMLDDLKAKCEFDKRKQEIAKFNKVTLNTYI
jgi:xanthine dehydrogenase molybdopterin-binding subunit B